MLRISISRHLKTIRRLKIFSNRLTYSPKAINLLPLTRCSPATPPLRTINRRRVINLLRLLSPLRLLSHISKAIHLRRGISLNKAMVLPKDIPGLSPYPVMATLLKDTHSHKIMRRNLPCKTRLTLLNLINSRSGSNPRIMLHIRPQSSKALTVRIQYPLGLTSKPIPDMPYRHNLGRINLRLTDQAGPTEEATKMHRTCIPMHLSRLRTIQCMLALRVKQRGRRQTRMLSIMAGMIGIMTSKEHCGPKAMMPSIQV